jgi:hypothetical protein
MTERFQTLQKRTRWAPSFEADTLTIHCGPNDFDGWVDKVTGRSWSPGASWEAEGVCGGNYAALSLYPGGTPYEAGEQQKIILCDQALTGPPNYRIPTLKDLHHEYRRLGPSGYISHFAQDTVSSTLLHELFHCAFHREGESLPRLAGTLRSLS